MKDLKEVTDLAVEMVRAEGGQYERRQLVRHMIFRLGDQESAYPLIPVKPFKKCGGDLVNAECLLSNPGETEKNNLAFAFVNKLLKLTIVFG